MERASYTKVDCGEGYVYLVKAKGFHGRLLSPLLGRYKIGLTNNPERRLNELNSQQAPCPIVGIRNIAVRDNATVERALHQKFAKQRRHGEWFDFWVWELPLVEMAYDRAEKPLSAKVSKIAIAGMAILVLGAGGIGFAIASTNSPERGDTLRVVEPIK